MSKEKEAYNYVLSQVASEIDDLYRYYQKKDSTLEDKEKTMEQLNTLIEKKYINTTYISDLMLIVDYYAKKEYAMYFNNLNNYILRIRIFLEN